MLCLIYYQVFLSDSSEEEQDLGPLAGFSPLRRDQNKPQGLAGTAAKQAAPFAPITESSRTGPVLTNTGGLPDSTATGNSSVSSSFPTEKPADAKHRERQPADDSWKGSSMNVAKLLEKRRVQWSELERLCDAMEMRGRTEKSGLKHHRGAEGIARFSTLYRAACADLALADAYQLPPGTVTYLHRLVARSHNQLYRANKFEPQSWSTILFEVAPQQIFADPCARIATIIFFGLFSLSMFLGMNEDMFPGFADRMVGSEMLSQLEDSYSQP